MSHAPAVARISLTTTPQACTDATVGTECRCQLNGVTPTSDPLPIGACGNHHRTAGSLTLIFRAGCMQSAQLTVSLPSSQELVLLAHKPANVSQEVRVRVAATACLSRSTRQFILDNPGGDVLEWNLATSGIDDLKVTPSDGNLSARSTMVLTVTFASTHALARAEAYTGFITINALSGGAVCKPIRCA